MATTPPPAQNPAQSLSQTVNSTRVQTLAQRVQALEPSRLRAMRRGLEKESLRALPSGMLALTPHPEALGSPLTHPGITTDFSESQVELVTGTHASAEEALKELTQLHQATLHVLKAEGGEMLWTSSMPCGLPTDETIPIARFGSSNVGRAKSIYRMGLSHRYGRRMQTISGIHYNWSMPGLGNEEYFALIRNFRRHAFLLLVLFGASPAVCSTFVEGRSHALQSLVDPASSSAEAGNLPCAGTMYMPHGTSLRMGRLGYQSDAQASLAVSYNSLEGYAASLHEALTQSYPAYEKVGIQNLGGDYNQLATTLLQIENEFYGTIRPKRVIHPGERPLHALRERGVEYIEVRLMDLDPFEPVGIAASTMRLLDVFLLHCLLEDSPPDSPVEIAEIQHNQHLTAARGREPGLRLKRCGVEVPLVDWALELLRECAPIAQALDVAHGHGPALHTLALAAAQASLLQPQTLPSARVLAAMQEQHDNSFVQFIRGQSEKTHAQILDLPFSAGQQAHFAKLRVASVLAQSRIETMDSLPFEIYRQKYVSADRLGQPVADSTLAKAAAAEPA